MKFWTYVIGISALLLCFASWGIKVALDRNPHWRFRLEDWLWQAGACVLVAILLPIMAIARVVAPRWYNRKPGY